MILEDVPLRFTALLFSEIFEFNSRFPVIYKDPELRFSGEATERFFAKASASTFGVKPEGIIASFWVSGVKPTFQLPALLHLESFCELLKVKSPFNL